MIDDILTVMWKERKELFTERETVRGTLASFLGPLIMMAALGVVLPWQAGRVWVETPLSLGPSLFVSLMFGGMTAGTIAGERERHTLETLLASRLPDQAILFGKIAIAVWGRVLLYPPTVVVADLLVSILVSTLTATMGVFVSLRAATVRQAEQDIMALLAGGSMLLALAPSLALRTIPGLEARFAELLARLNLTQIVAVVLLVLIALDAAFLVAAMHRFQRARLILV
jgi:ABC-2 type transport system permease protein